MQILKKITKSKINLLDQSYNIHIHIRSKLSYTNIDSVVNFTISNSNNHIVAPNLYILKNN